MSAHVGRGLLPRQRQGMPTWVSTWVLFSAIWLAIVLLASHLLGRGGKPAGHGGGWVGGGGGGSVGRAAMAKQNSGQAEF